MQFCSDKEAKCPENGQLLDNILSTVNILIENIDVYVCMYINMYTITCIHIQ